jgi:Kef-type K+ transport system membrane component KefB
MTLLLAQMTVVLAVTFTCGEIARKFGQSRVIGEMIGGILLGPSAFGHLAPRASATLFPSTSLGAFDVLSTVGLIFFLFLIGAEIDYASLRSHRNTAALSSALSIFLPFLMAIAIAPALRIRFAPVGVAPLPFALFLGISLSITAFPVLARILEERRLQSTPLGTTALMCAAVDDVCAWTLLAVALALIPHASHSTSVLTRLLWLTVYIVVMAAVIRPLASTLSRIVMRSNAKLSQELAAPILALTIVLVIVSAATTNAIGVHPLFGAFIAGLCFPRVPAWQTALRKRLDLVVSVLLLPFFFALTGMRTQLNLLSGSRIWLWTAIIFAIAVAGKIGGAVIAARTTGESWRNALALGALLNTRGLVELIVLNIAYNAGIFSPELFSMLVVMALVTTMMTTPLLNLLHIRNPHNRLS